MLFICENDLMYACILGQGLVRTVYARMDFFEWHQGGIMTHR